MSILSFCGEAFHCAKSGGKLWFCLQPSESRNDVILFVCPYDQAISFVFEQRKNPSDIWRTRWCPTCHRLEKHHGIHGREEVRIGPRWPGTIVHRSLRVVATTGLSESVGRRTPGAVCLPGGVPRRHGPPRPAPSRTAGERPGAVPGRGTVPSSGQAAPPHAGLKDSLDCNDGCIE
jgi:hypothetical protein